MRSAFFLDMYFGEIIQKEHKRRLFWTQMANIEYFKVRYVLWAGHSEGTQETSILTLNDKHRILKCIHIILNFIWGSRKEDTQVLCTQCPLPPGNLCSLRRTRFKDSRKLARRVGELGKEMNPDISHKRKWPPTGPWKAASSSPYSNGKPVVGWMSLDARILKVQSRVAIFIHSDRSANGIPGHTIKTRISRSLTTHQNSTDHADQNRKRSSHNLIWGFHLGRGIFQA